MGQNQSNKAATKPAKKQRPQEDDSSEDGDDNIVNEACPFIVVNVIYELPDGQTQKEKFNIITSKKAKVVKMDFEKHFNIKQNQIQVYLNGGQVEMPNDYSLHELKIKNNSTLTIRDGSLKYNL